MKYLTVEQVIDVNYRLIMLFSPTEMIGVKDIGLLESAVNRPQQSIFGEDAYPTVFEKAAVLFESLAKNHPFQNANKRTAFACMTMFLYQNDCLLKMDQKLAEDVTVAMVNGKFDVQDIASMLPAYCDHK